MRIGIDAMGSDGAPATEVRGALEAREFLSPDDRIVLVGRREEILPHLEGSGDWQQYIDVEHAEQVVTMNESPVEALRAKPQSSLMVLAQLAHAGELDACVSAGNTGAFVAAAQMRLRRLDNVHRPGIAILTPTFHGPVAVCDVGANVQPRPQHLHQYGVMASVYIEALCGIDRPRVGLLSIGEEDAKGNELVKATRELMKDDANLNFIGNIEGRDLFRGAADVVVADGFTGNVVLKLIEGMAEGMLKGMLSELASEMPQHIESIKKAARVMMDKYDFNEYGGAPLLGVNGICMICHGASDHNGIKNAVAGAAKFAKYHLNDRIVELLSAGQRTVNG
jgi:glycerol-3-phosphate acyltransferase PlsX